LNYLIERAGHLSSAQIDELVELWRHSVAATHTFLSAEDIEGLRPLVVWGIVGLSRLYVAVEPNGRFCGFMAVETDKLAMLFVRPDCLHCGIGSALLTTAVKKFKICRVDVNEQNPVALKFYQKHGFQIFSRSEFDADGNHFPILHLQKTTK